MAFPSKKYFEINELKQLKNFLFKCLFKFRYFYVLNEKDYIHQYVFISHEKNKEKIKKLDIKLNYLSRNLNKEKKYLNSLKISELSVYELNKLIFLKKRKLKRFNMYISLLVIKRAIFKESYLYYKEQNDFISFDVNL